MQQASLRRRWTRPPWEGELLALVCDEGSSSWMALCSLEYGVLVLALSQRLGDAPPLQPADSRGTSSPGSFPPCSCQLCPLPRAPGSGQLDWDRSALKNVPWQLPARWETWPFPMSGFNRSDDCPHHRGHSSTSGSGEGCQREGQLVPGESHSSKGIRESIWLSQCLLMMINKIPRKRGTAKNFSTP